MTAPHEVVERALAESTSAACIVLVHSRSVANLRWARTNLTTNGETQEQSVTVIAIVDLPDGPAAGSVTVKAPGDEQLRAAVRQAEQRAREAGPADDAAELVAGLAASPDWADAPEVATSEAFVHLAPALGDVFARARVDDIEHFGYAEQVVTTVHLGTSTGVRLRFVAPEARLELTAKSHHRSRSTWHGSSGHSFDDIDLAGIDAELRTELAWQATRVEVEPGRHPALLAPAAVADLMLHLYWDSSGRDAAEGGSVWSRAGGGTRIGERVADERVRLFSDPRLPGL